MLDETAGFANIWRKECLLTSSVAFSELFLSVAVKKQQAAIPLTCIGMFDIILVSAVVLGTLHLASIQS
jgi:hypothetical protein